MRADGPDRDGWDFLEDFGGAEEDRTPDLRIANATLSQLSYGPTGLGRGTGPLFRVRGTYKLPSHSSRMRLRPLRQGVKAAAPR